MGDAALTKEWERPVYLCCQNQNPESENFSCHGANKMGERGEKEEVGVPV